MNYEKIYKNIISKAQSRDKLDGYIERHHIIPRSFGGSDDAINIVALTAREHFLAHFCLWKFSSGDNRRKMAFAFRAMRMDQYNSRYINSKLYAKLRQDLKHSDATKVKIGLGQKGAKHTLDRVTKIQNILARNRLLMTPEKKIAKRLAERIAYWQQKDLAKSNT